MRRRAAPANIKDQSFMIVVWANAATHDLRNIHRYISQDNPTAAA